MSDVEFQARIVHLTAALTRLEKLQQYSQEEFLSDFRTSDAALLNFQIAIETLTSIANYLLKRISREIPATRAMIFERLCDLGILDESLRSKLDQMTCF